MRILVTGATGYLGCELALTLASEGHTVHALVRNAATAEALIHEHIVLYQGDITNPESVLAAMSGCEQVYHTAAFVKLCATDRKKFYDCNVKGTVNVLQAALLLAVKRVVFTSTCGVWGVTGDLVFKEAHPRIAALDNDYEVSKIMAEKVVADYCARGLDCVIVNPSKVFGFGRHHNPARLNYNKFVNSWLHQRWILLPWKLQVTSNLVFLRDAVAGHILAMQKGRRGERYILGGENISVADVMHAVQGVTNQKKRFVRIPSAIIYGWSIVELILAKITRRDPLIVPSMIPRLSKHARYSSALAVQQLGYRITPFREALHQTFIDSKNIRA